LKSYYVVICLNNIGINILTATTVTMLLFSLGSALLLGSWIGVVLGILLEGIIAGRAVGEERVLQKGLKGYDAYMAQVRWRLIPHV
jgi:protein-S-isoprenylcysteine O-methyltransferase Ste14